MIPLGVLASARVAVAGGGPVVTDYDSGVVNASSWSWTLDVGEPFAGRHLMFAAIGDRESNTSPYGLTSNGSALSLVQQINGWSRACMSTGVIPFPSGTTVDVVFSTPPVAIRAFVGVWVLPSAPTIIHSLAAASGTLTLNTGAGGWILGCAYNTSSVSGTVTDWSNTARSRTAIGFSTQTDGSQISLTSTSPFAAVSFTLT